MSKIITLILAAGRSTRMKSRQSKILHMVASRPMIEYVFDLGKAFSGEELYTLVNPEMMPGVAEQYRGHSQFIIQDEQKGTGHAVQVALDTIQAKSLNEAEWVLVLYGDTPLLEVTHLEQMQAVIEPNTAIVLSTMHVEAPNQYGRVIVDQGEVRKIVEFKDACEAERAESLCNGGVMLLKKTFLEAQLHHLKPSAKTREIYLTDLIELASRAGHQVKQCELPEAALMGVNRRAELAFVEAKMQDKLRAKVMAGGATLLNPKTVFLAYDTKFGTDVLVEPNVFFGPNVVVEDCVHIKAFSHLEGCRICTGAKIGPFARLRPGTEIGKGSAIGNFVEIKNSTLHEGVKAGHLAYIGDAEIYEQVNIGAGTITCNYDGNQKHHTEIGSGAFVGSNTALVAPIIVGKGAHIGAGSVITKAVPDDMLAIARGRQKNLKRRK